MPKPKGKTFAEKEASYKEALNQIAEAILSQMQQLDGNWQMPWHKGLPVAINVKTGKQYGGNNLLVLWMKSLKNQYKHNQWATLRQWAAVKAKVKKGEKGTLICLAIPKHRKGKKDIQYKLFEPLRPNEINQRNTFFRFRFIHVFNEAQVTGYFGNQPGIFEQPPDGVPLIIELVSRSKASIKKGGDSAYYIMSTDTIHMPDFLRFKNTPSATRFEHYYSTLLHELLHWTGHSTRCDRKLLNTFGSPEYALEELVAELGSALLSTQLNQKQVPLLDHAQYLKSWLKVLKNDFSFFTETLELARTAIYFLNELTGIYPYDLKPMYQRKVNEERVEGWKGLS